MKISRAHQAQYSAPHKSRGIALLLMLSFLIIALTAVAITRISLNDSAQKRKMATQKALTDTRDAIMAWTLTQNFLLTTPPGTLPCPDIDLDGFSDKPTINCSGEIGFVPYRTLGIPEPRDGDGALLWYAVSNTYARSVNVALNQFRNSSLVSPLFLNNPADTQAFILISQNDAVAGQNRGNVSVANRAQFLDGINADNNFNDYGDLLDETHNDQILAVSVSSFWALVEERVFVDMKALLTQYFSACNRYPWAMPFAATDGLGIADTYEGRLPKNNQWGELCNSPPQPAPLFQPQWLRDHWGDVLYYALCKDPVAAVNPPTNSCLDLGNGVSAKVIIVGPGSAFNWQDRAIPNINNYLENENAAPVNNIFQQTSRTNHTALFNDLINIVAP